MTRKELIQRLSWNSGGMGYGVASIGMQLAMRMSGKTIPSIVVVSIPQDKYTDEELSKLVAFSEKMTEDFKRRFGGPLLGDNCICLEKMEGCWMRKKLTWECGPMTSPTLDEALAVFDKEYA